MTRATLSPEMLARATPTIRFLSDTPAEGCLVARVFRSPHPHALIRSLDLSAARGVPGVRAAVSAADLPRGFLHGLRLKDQPAMATGRVRMVGEPVAAIAAETAEAAEAALAAIAVLYDPLPAVLDPAEALAPGAPPLHEGGNLCHARDFARGDTRAVRTLCAHVVTHEIETPRQAHIALELEGGVAIPRADGGLAIHAPSQHPHGMRALVAGALDWPESAVEVIGSPIGGSYGGKEDVHIQILIALLARAAARPVRLVLTRAENMVAGYKRHPFRIRMTTGCDAEGRLLLHEADLLADTGAYASHGPEVLDTAHECAQGPYDIPNVRIRSRLAYTNNGIAGAFRGFGAVQVQCAVELQIDALAEASGLSPAEFRARNLPRGDAPGPLGTPVVPRPETAMTAQALSAMPDPGTMRSERLIRARGVALVQKGEGFAHGAAEAAEARLDLSPDGRIRVACALTEMGQGVTAAARAAFAARLGVDATDVALMLGRTPASPDAGPTSASRGTQVLWRLAAEARRLFGPSVLETAAARLGRDPADLRLGPGGVWTEGANEPLLGFTALAGIVAPMTLGIGQVSYGTPVPGADVHHILTTCGAVADIAIDRLTGRVRVERMHLLPACGKVLDPASFRGQVEGGAVMAQGFVLTEDLPFRDGHALAGNLDSYLVPTLADAPEIAITEIALAPDDPVGLRGVGEIATNAAAPAIACAVRQALGAAPPRLPVDPGWVLDRIGEMR